MYKKIKQPIDLFLSVLGLISISPVFFIIIIILSIQNKGKIFFKQERVGLNEKLFMLIKFKTMTEEKDIYGKLLPDNQRITRFGKFLRSSSLDELPQLLNVFTGKMSFIGPRPLLSKYLPLYNNFQRERHSVRPGITGWAQINGRNQISWQQKFEYDVFYVEHISAKLDFKIFLLTIKKILIREGINSSSTITMDAFNGKN